MEQILGQIKELLTGRSRFAIISHIRPDGDAYGTSLALAWTLRAIGKEVQVFNQDGLNRSFAYLPGSEMVRSTPEGALEEGWQWLAVDTSNYERLGENFSRTGRRPDLNLDHHASNTQYGLINWVVGESPASAQVLFELIQSLQLPLVRQAAINLYVGLMTDTGSFRYRGTTARSLEVADQLVQAGADPSYLADQSYRRNSIGDFNLMREVLNATEFYAEDRVATYTLTQEMFRRTGADPGEVEGFLDILQTVETVEVAFMLQEVAEGVTRVSLRSRARVNVSELAGKFGGGGHKLAAGIRTVLPREVLKVRLLREICAALL